METMLYLLGQGSVVSRSDIVCVSALYAALALRENDDVGTSKECSLSAVVAPCIASLRLDGCTRMRASPGKDKMRGRKKVFSSDITGHDSACRTPLDSRCMMYLSHILDLVNAGGHGAPRLTGADMTLATLLRLCLR